jgi:hypothetical protein
MIRSIVITYKQNIVIPAMETKKISYVDSEIFEQLLSGVGLGNQFYHDNNASIIMLKLFMRLMNNEQSYKEDTHNKYRKIVVDIINIYDELNERFGLGEMINNYQDSYFYGELLSKTNEAFVINLYAKVVHYFNHTFRDSVEESKFLNYLYSLCYAYLCYEKHIGAIESFEPVEHGILTCVEQEIEPQENFYYNYSIGTCAIELLHNMYENLGEKYDLRKLVNNSDIQDYFRRLDDNYDTKFDPDIMIYDFSIDKKLEKILDTMLVDGMDSVLEILKGDESIYNLLFDNGLDPRYENHFKMLLIKKIYGDAYEAEYYYRGVESRAVFPHVEELEQLPKKDNYLFGYFFNYGDELLDIYAYYHNEEEHVREKARTKVYEDGKLPIVMSMNAFAHFNYINIVKENKENESDNEDVKKKILKPKKPSDERDKKQ